MQANHLGRQCHDEIHSERRGYAYPSVLDTPINGIYRESPIQVPVPVPMLMPMRSYSIMMMEYWKTGRVEVHEGGHGGAPAANQKDHLPRVNLPGPSFLAEGLRFSFSTKWRNQHGMGELSSVRRGSSARKQSMKE